MEEMMQDKQSKLKDLYNMYEYFFSKLCELKKQDDDINEDIIETKNRLFVIDGEIKEIEDEIRREEESQLRAEIDEVDDYVNGGNDNLLGEIDFAF